jgi:hypothetical protein
MRIVSPHQIEMDGESGVERQRAEELGREEDVVVAEHLPLGDIHVVGEIRPAGHVDHRPHQRLVERDQGVGVAADARTVAQRLRDGLPEGDPGVLHRMVAVHVKIAAALDGEIQQRVPREGFEHVVEEADTRAHLRLAPAVEDDADAEVGFVGLAVDVADAGHRPEGKP